MCGTGAFNLRPPCQRTCQCAPRLSRNSSSNAYSMQADAFKRLYPEQYFARFIQEGVRPDGRPVGQARPTTIGLKALSSADGSALVKIGSTTALACIKLEVYNPQDGNETEGNLQVNVELTPLCSPDYRPGRQPEAAQFISSRVNSLLKKCKVVDPRQLCILESRAAWMVNVDVFVLDANGSVLDAVLLAAVSALSDLSLPAVSVSQEGNVARADSEPQGEGAATTTAKRLQLRCQPMYLSLGVFNGQLIADPTREEEPLLSASVQVALDEKGNILDLCKAGGQPVASQMLHSCIEAARLRYREVAELLQQQLLDSC